MQGLPHYPSGWSIEVVPRTWARELHCFMDLSTKFIAQYRHLIPKKVTSSDLFSIRQGENESMESYQAKFKEFYRRIEIEKADEKIAVSAFIRGLQPGKFLENLVRNAPVDLADVFHRGEMKVKVEQIRATLSPRAIQDRVQGKRKYS